jgi:hypothetical protein
MVEPVPGGLSAHLRPMAEVLSAFLGIGGTCLMTRRYAQSFWTALLFALILPIKALAGRWGHAQQFFEKLGKVNWDVPASPHDMALGMNLLFWAFFLQLLVSLSK